MTQEKLRIETYSPEFFSSALKSFPLAPRYAEVALRIRDLYIPPFDDAKKMEEYAQECRRRRIVPSGHLRLITVDGHKRIWGQGTAEDVEESLTIARLPRRVLKLLAEVTIIGEKIPRKTYKIASGMFRAFADEIIGMDERGGYCIVEAEVQAGEAKRGQDGYTGLHMDERGTELELWLAKGRHKGMVTRKDVDRLRKWFLDLQTSI